MGATQAVAQGVTQAAPTPPRRSFGEVLASAAGEVLKVGGVVASALVPGGPVVGGALVAAGRALSEVGGGAPEEGAGTGGKDPWELLEAQRAMQAEGQAVSLAYLELQDAMQRESREFNAVSNVLKVRHDSAKAAINNIR